MPTALAGRSNTPSEAHAGHCATMNKPKVAPELAPTPLIFALAGQTLGCLQLYTWKDNVIPNKAANTMNKIALYQGIIVSHKSIF